MAASASKAVCFFLFGEKFVELCRQCIWWSSLDKLSDVVVQTDGAQTLQASHSAECYINCEPAHITAELAWKEPVEDQAWVRRSAL